MAIKQKEYLGTGNEFNPSIDKISSATHRRRRQVFAKTASYN